MRAFSLTFATSYDSSYEVRNNFYENVLRALLHFLLIASAASLDLMPFSLLNLCDLCPPCPSPQQHVGFFLFSIVLGFYGAVDASVWVQSH